MLRTSMGQRLGSLIRAVLALERMPRHLQVARRTIEAHHSEAMGNEADRFAALARTMRRVDTTR